MMANIWWSLPLTLAVFFAARKLAARFKMPLLNPLLVAMVVIIPFLLLTGIPYERYFAGSRPWWRSPFLYMSNCTRSAPAGNPSLPSVLSGAWWR